MHGAVHGAVHYMNAHDTETVYQTQRGWERCILTVEYVTIVSRGRRLINGRYIASGE